MQVIGDVIRLNAKRFPNKKALITGDGHLTFLELNRRASLLAHALLRKGVKPGDRIGIMSFNSLEWMVAFFAIAKAGGVIVPINFRYRKDELVYVVNHAGCGILFFGPEFTGLVEEARGEFGDPPSLIPIDPAGGEGNMGALMEGMPATEPPVAVDPSWPFSIMYTSGTTGVPKGALSSHGAFMHNYLGLMVDCGLTDDDVGLSTLPFFHAAGVHCLIMPVFMRGGTCVMLPAGFEPERVLDAIARHKVTMSHWVPTQLAMLINSGLVEKYDISSLRTIWYGSSPIPPAVLERCLKEIRTNFYQTYGQTETLIVSVLRPEEHFSERSQFTGREIFNSELRILDEKGQDVATGGVGEIVSRQRGTGMTCYYKAEEATAQTIRNGWIHTGDLARSEGGGYFTIVDRIKDVIISGAENVYPKEIENLIGRHPAVKEVAVFGIPDDVWGESVCAAVVRHAGHDIDEKGMIEFCGARLSSYKKPKRVIFVDELPRNAAGKVTKNILREPFWAGRQKRI